jgi:hypothetical protein
VTQEQPLRQIGSHCSLIAVTSPHSPIRIYG